MTGGLHYMLSCLDCGIAIPLPFEMLAQAASLQLAPTRDIEPVAVVCARCNRVRNYDLAQKSQNPPWGPMVLLPQTSDWEYVGWLECDEPSCKARLPLFASRSRHISAEDWRKSTLAWMWDDLKCAGGHTILKPK